MRPAFRHSRRRALAALVLLATAAPASAVAAPSDLDPAYGSGGTTSIDARPGTRAEDLTPYRAVEPAGGGVFVTGQSDTGAVFIAKYTAAGALDPAFGTGGLVLLDFGPGSVDEPGGIAIDSQNRVVVAGRADDEAFLARYTPAGELDTTFAGDGVLVHPTPGDTVSFSDLALDTDDGVYVATSSAPTTIRRYTAAGTLDFGFGIAGVSTPDQFGSIRLDLDPTTRRLVIGGDQSGNSYRFARLQGKADPFAGNYDATFSGDGQLDITSPQAPGTFKDLDVAADGTIAVVGTTSTEGHTVIRLTAAGVVAGLDGDGVITNAATASLNDEPVAIDASVAGAYIVGGKAGGAGGYLAAVIVSSGAHGTTFSIGCETGSVCTPADLTTRSGARFYLVGRQDSGANAYVAARVGSSGSADSAFGGDGFAALERRVPWGLTTVTSSLDSSGNLTTFGQAGLYNDESSFLLRQGPTGAVVPGFGSGGAVVADLQPSATENTAAAASAGDGAWFLAPAVAGSGDLVLRRMTASGLDGSFGVGGSVTVPIATTPGHEFQPLALAVDAQGRVVVAGEQFGPGGSDPRSAVIVRILPQSGTIDPNFNGGAPVRFNVTDGGSVEEQLSSLAILPNGDILAGGRMGSQAVVVRRTSSGTPAPGFGTNGRAALPALGTRESGAPVRVMASSDGTVFVGTSIVKGSTDREIAVGRLTASGALDPTYGTAGVATVAPSDSAAHQLADMVLDHLGRAVIVGQRTPTGASAGFVARLTLDGQPDSEFAAGGRVVLDLAGGGSSRLLDVHLRSRKILAVGDAVDNATKTGRVVTVQLIGDPEPAPAPTATPTPTPTPTITPAIRSTITPLRRPRARKALTLKGTATPTGGTTTRVQISIRRIKKGACLYLRSAKSRSLRSIKPVRGACTKPVFLAAKGTTSWSLALRKGLPAGTYEITSRATLSTGLVEGSFVAGRNVLRVKIK